MLKVNKKAKPEKILLGEEVYILWQDGHESHISFFDLRNACPCASCVDELSGEKTLDPGNIPNHLAGLPGRLFRLFVQQDRIFLVEYHVFTNHTLLNIFVRRDPTIQIRPSP